MKNLKDDEILSTQHATPTDPIVELCQDKNEIIYNEQNDRLLYLAKSENNPELIKKSIQAGAEINTQDEYGATALLNATHYENNDVVAVLIELKANLNSQDEDGNTALHYAVMIKNRIAIDYLVAVGANPNIRNNNNKTALKLAQKRNDHKTLKSLIPSVDHKIRFYFKKKS